MYRPVAQEPWSGWPLLVFGHSGTFTRHWRTGPNGTIHRTVELEATTDFLIGVDSDPDRESNEPAEEAVSTAEAASGPRVDALAVPNWHAGLPTLRGQHVTLREPDEADAESLVAMLATDEVGRFMNRPPSRPEAFAAFTRWARTQRRLGRNFCYGIIPEGHDHPVGLIQVRQVEPGFASAEWGFAIGQPYWGQNIFPPAGRMVIDFIFRSTAAHRLEARSAIQNGRANGALKKLGATPEGVLRQSFIVNEEPLHQVLWALRSEEWPLADPPCPYWVEPAPPDANEAEVESATASKPVPAAGPVADWCVQVPELRGAGVTVRELRDSDAEPLVRLVTTPDVGRYILPPPGTLEGFRRFIAWALEERAAGRYVCMGVVPDGCDHAVGIFQLHRVDQVFNIGEWGFVLGRPYWGSGLFPESARLFLDFTFDTVGVRRLEARAAQANGRANGALRKLGAAREGSMKRSFLLGGEYHDDYLWSMLAEDREQ